MNEDKIDLILEKLKKLEETVLENNNILKSKRSSERWSKFFWLIKWIVIVSLGILTWTYIQPFYNSIINASGDMNNTIKEINETINTLKNKSN